MGSNLLLFVVVGTALAFDFTNGFHDTANAMAASIATRALPPRAAVALSAVLNVVGAFLSLAVATTIAKGVVDPSVITLNIVFAGLIGAITWNLVTWYFGLPSSSSHALIGGVVGAALVAKGTAAIKGAGIVEKVLIPAVLAPFLAGGIAIAGTYLAYRLTRRERPEHVTRGFRYGQIASASLVSLAHGTNDAQKTMGIITLALIAHGSLDGGAGVPTWVIISAALAIGGGTYIGGWRVIRTMGTRITAIEPPQGFAADASSAAVILASSHYGFPLSTTHVTAGSIIGSGVGRNIAGRALEPRGTACDRLGDHAPRGSARRRRHVVGLRPDRGHGRGARDGGRRRRPRHRPLPRDAQGPGQRRQHLRARVELEPARCDPARAPRARRRVRGATR